MTLIGSLGASVVVGHIGDSRAYLFRGGKLHQLTRDHTWVQTMVDLGLLSAEEAARHPKLNVLIRSLGGQAPNVEGDFQRVWLAHGDQLLLCTDGLTNMVDDSAIASLLGSAATSNEACQALVAAALEKGGIAALPYFPCFGVSASSCFTKWTTSRYRAGEQRSTKRLVRWSAVTVKPVRSPAPR